MASNSTDQTHSNRENESKYMKRMAKSILLLATLVATATYAAGFSPPGGVWQETDGHNLPGDPIIRSTQYLRYLMFFYCNAAAFAASFMVLVLILLFMIPRRQPRRQQEENPRTIVVVLLVLVMLLGLLSLTGAYATGTFRDVFTAVFTSLLVAAVFTYVAVEKLLAYFGDKGSNVVMAASLKERHNRNKVLMQLATFALAITYSSGLSTPGGFWDSTDGGNRPGDAILKGARPKVFFVCNTMAFVASLLMVLVLLLRKIRRMKAVYAGSVVLLFGLLGSYVAGSCRETNTTIYMASLIGAIVACSIIFVVVVTKIPWERIQEWFNAMTQIQDPRNETAYIIRQLDHENQAHSTYVEYLATLALTITYVAGLHPPGGLWQDDGDGHKAGDPILRTTNLRRYNAFFYSNSVAFAASVACMILVHFKRHIELKKRALEQSMMLDLLGLVGSYAFGSCRVATATVYTAGIGGAAVVYVVLHVVFMDVSNDTDGRRMQVEKYDRPWALKRMGYGFFVFAIFVATITYQAGLTPPGGFLLKDDESGNHAGDPVLLHNYPRRYRVFFYCNSASFMVSIAIIILLVNPKLCRPAIQTHALSVCTAVSFFCLLAAFAAGTTQHLKTSIYTLVLLAVVFCSAVLLIILLFFVRSAMSSSSSAADDAKPTNPTSSEGNAQAKEDAIAEPPIPTSSEGNAQAGENTYAELLRETKKNAQHNKRIYMMTVGILVGSVTYQAGLDPPGGSWQRSSDGHNAGSPVMHNNMRQRYLLFFFSNSASFVASIFLMLLLLPWTNKLKKRLPRFMNAMLMLGFLGLLGAYATGSNRERKTSVYIIAIFFSVLAYFSALLGLSLQVHKRQIMQRNEAESKKRRGTSLLLAFRTTCNNSSFPNYFFFENTHVRVLL